MGGTGRLRPGGADGHAERATNSPPAFAPRGTRRCTTKSWGGYPDAEFLSRLSPKLGALRERLCAKARDISCQRGRTFRANGRARTGLREGIPVAVGAFDAHLGAVGAGIAPGTLVKIIGTSTCDIAVWPLKEKLADIPGLCGIVSGSVLPDCYGLEAGQSAVGDIFNWFVNYIQPGGGQGRFARGADQGGRRGCGRGNRACWRWIGTTATARCWWTSG